LTIELDLDNVKTNQHAKLV